MTKQNFFQLKRNNKDKKILYNNARIIDPESRKDFVGQLLTIGSEIADFGTSIFTNIPQDIEVIECNGHVLCPGLLDIQVHFREPGQEYKEEIMTGSKSAVAGGVTRVVCMPNTKPVIDEVSVLEFINKKARDNAYCHIHAYGAITKGQKGQELSEMALLKEAGAVGFTDDGLPVMNSLVMRRAMEYAKMLGVPICQHAEDVHLSNGGCVNEGIYSEKLGLPGIPNASEAIIVARDLLLLELVGGHYHVLHLSTHQALDLVRRAKDQGLNVTCEVAPHHFILNDSVIMEYDTCTKMNPPLRDEKDRLALIEGLKDGTIDAIATDHAPHDFDSKNVPITQAAFGIVGLETMLPLSLELYHRHSMDLIDILAAMTYKPADIIRVAAGRIKKGAIADLTLIDLNKKWEIDPNAFVSKSKNSPFDKFITTGRVVRTIVAGETVYLLED